MACPVDMAGQFIAPVTDFEGYMLSEADRQIIRHLKDQGLSTDKKSYSTAIHFARDQTPPSSIGLSTPGT